MNFQEMRRHPREEIAHEIMVNDGCPYQGGTLQNMSIGGAAITYPPELGPASAPITVGQVVMLKLQGKTTMPSRVTRIFDGGFATKFDFSLPIAH
jgi:hypothetical protein